MPIKYEVTFIATQSSGGHTERITQQAETMSDVQKFLESKGRGYSGWVTSYTIKEIGEGEKFAEPKTAEERAIDRRPDYEEALAKQQALTGAKTPKEREAISAMPLSAFKPGATQEQEQPTTSEEFQKSLFSRQRQLETFQKQAEKQEVPESRQAKPLGSIITAKSDSNFELRAPFSEPVLKQKSEFEEKKSKPFKDLTFDFFKKAGSAVTETAQNIRSGFMGGIERFSKDILNRPIGKAKTGIIESSASFNIHGQEVSRKEKQLFSDNNIVFPAIQELGEKGKRVIIATGKGIYEIGKVGAELISKPEVRRTIGIGAKALAVTAVTNPKEFGKISKAAAFVGGAAAIDYTVGVSKHFKKEPFATSIEAATFGGIIKGASTAGKAAVMGIKKVAGIPEPKTPFKVERVTGVEIISTKESLPKKIEESLKVRYTLQSEVIRRQKAPKTVSNFDVAFQRQKVASTPDIHRISKFEVEKNIGIGKVSNPEFVNEPADIFKASSVKNMEFDVRFGTSKLEAFEFSKPQTRFQVIKNERTIDFLEKKPLESPKFKEKEFSSSQKIKTGIKGILSTSKIKAVPFKQPKERKSKAGKVIKPKLIPGSQKSNKKEVEDYEGDIIGLTIQKGVFKTKYAPIIAQTEITSARQQALKSFKTASLSFPIFKSKQESRLSQLPKISITSKQRQSQDKKILPGSIFSMQTSSKSDTRALSDSIFESRSDISKIPKTSISEIQKEKQERIQKPKLEITPKTDIPRDPILRTPPTRLPPTRLPPRPRLRIPESNTKIFTKVQKLSKRAERSFSYTPSFTALTFGIKKKLPKNVKGLTGLEIRPIRDFEKRTKRKSNNTIRFNY